MPGRDGGARGGLPVVECGGAREGDGDKSGILDMEYWEQAGGAATWAELYGQPLASKDATALRKCTYAGRPFGSEEFVKEMEERFQRRWLRRAMAGEKLAKSA